MALPQRRGLLGISDIKNALSCFQSLLCGPVCHHLLQFFTEGHSILESLLFRFRIHNHSSRRVKGSEDWLIHILLGRLRWKKCLELPNFCSPQDSLSAPVKLSTSWILWVYWKSTGRHCDILAYIMFRKMWGQRYFKKISIMKCLTSCKSL